MRSIYIEDSMTPLDVLSGLALAVVYGCLFTLSLAL